MQELVSLCQNSYSADILKNTTVESCLNAIKNGTKVKELILQARQFGKGSKEFDKIKKTQIPTINWTGIFSPTRSLSNIKELSQYIYFDIDISHINNEEIEHDIMHFKEKLYKLSEIQAYWESFSNKGLGILVKFSGLTKDNYLFNWLIYEKIFASMGIKVDRQTKNLSRINYLSYDPYIYINLKVEPIEAIDYYEEEIQVAIDDRTIKFNGSDIITTYNTMSSLDQAFQIAINKHGNFVKGQRHAAKVLFFSTCNVFGIDRYEAISYLKANTACELIDIVGNSIYELYKHQFGNKIKK